MRTRLWRRLGGMAVWTAAIIAAPGSAAAAWLEASSEHFLIYGNVSETWLTKYSEQLEKLDAGMRYLQKVGASPGGRSNRLVIYVVPDATAVQRICGKCRDVAGFYVPRIGGSVAYTPRNSFVQDDGTSFAQIVLQHEYGHHFLLENFAAAYPRWFSEGFAEFGSTGKLNPDGSYTIGRPANHRAYSLVLGGNMPMEELLAPDDGKKVTSEHMDLFYGRAWALTHMLMFDPAQKGKLSAYLRQLQEGRPALDAARNTLGDLKVLGQDLDRYIDQRRLLALTIKADALPTGPVAIRRLSPGEQAMMDVRMRSDRGVTPEEAARIVVDARRRAAPFPDDAAAQLALAEAEFDADHLDEAEAAADRAIAADGKSVGGMLYKGQVRIARALADKNATPETWKEARTWFSRANRADPEAAEPLMRFYQSFVAAGIAPSRNAVAGLASAFARSPHDEGLRMMHAVQLLNDDNKDEARSVLAAIAFDPHKSGENAASRLLAQLDSGKSGPEALAAVSDTASSSAAAETD